MIHLKMWTMLWMFWIRIQLHSKQKKNAKTTNEYQRANIKKRKLRCLIQLIQNDWYNRKSQRNTWWLQNQRCVYLNCFWKQKIFSFCVIKLWFFTDEMCIAFKRLDDSAKKDFDSFLRKIVDILCDNEEVIEIRIGAAKEFQRQLTSRSKLFALQQMKKWNGLDSHTKEYVQNKVSIENIDDSFAKQNCCLFYSYCFIQPLVDRNAWGSQFARFGGANPKCCSNYCSLLGWLYRENSINLFEWPIFPAHIDGVI